MARTIVMPRARGSAELVVEELPDELLVYDTLRHKAHCLNSSAAQVFRMCDGRTSVDAAAAALAHAGLPGGVEVVEFALAELERAELLEAAPPVTRRAPSRRTALRRIGLIAGASLALPLIQSIVAPSVAQAASACGALNQPCCNGTSCDATLVCSGGTCGPNN